MPEEPKYPNVKVRPDCKRKIKELADATRINQLELVEVAVDAFDSLPQGQQDKLVRRRRPRAFTS